MTKPKNKKLPPKKPLPRHLRVFSKRVSNSRFAKDYLSLSVLILAVTTIIWAYLGASLNQSNADQVSNSYLLESSATFHNAELPGQHSFLIKWPIFLLAKLGGYRPSAFVALTILVCLVTVGGLALILYRIDRRPLVFGTLCLALASVLTLIPAQPYAGGLLPVNMAMLTTRNLEYLAYIGSLVLIIRHARFKDPWLWVGATTLGLLVASDKLFLSLSIGGAVLAVGFYTLWQNKKLARQALFWLLASLFAVATATVIFWLFNSQGLTHITNQTGLGVYGFVGSFKNLILAIIYAVMGTATNLGANPAFDATAINQIPDHIMMHLVSIGGVAYIINAIILATASYCVWRLVRSSVLHRKDEKWQDRPFILSIMLIFSSLTALAVFVVSNHYYAVDARYLTIVLFALFVSAATYARSRVWADEKIALVGSVLVISSFLGLFTAIGVHNDSRRALTGISNRTGLVVQALEAHPVDALVGDYWRVYPAKLIASTKLDVLPLDSCTHTRDTLSSKSWQVNLDTHSFAYLLSLDKSLTDYGNCTLEEILSAYGRPNASLLVAGTLDEPLELLLFYDKGAHKSAPTASQPTAVTATVVPISLESLPYRDCPSSTILNVVAHEDDDLLFMNPDLINEYEAGKCIRTVFITAGDAGQNEKYYWLGREQGAEAAYSILAKTEDLWIQRIVKVSDNQFLTVANPRANNRLSLIFMHLPDGGLNGQGFKAFNYESLKRLKTNRITQIHSVDGQSFYDLPQLQETLRHIMATYRPAQINTQSTLSGKQYPDHSDHMAVGEITKVAYKNYTEQNPDENVVINFYQGYPVHSKAVNVTEDMLDKKVAMFLAYATFDKSVCQSREECFRTSTYNAYLRRQYIKSE